MTTQHVRYAGGMLVASFLGGGLASAAFSGRVNAQTGPAIVTTPQINLVNRAGRIRGILSAEDDSGAASVVLFDGSDQKRAGLSVSADGTPVLQLYDAAQAARIVVTVENDQPAIVVNGAAGDRAMLGTLTGSPALTLQDRDRVRAEVGLGRGGAPRVALVGPTGQTQVDLNVSGAGEPVAALRDGTGRGRVTLGIVSGTTVINLADQQAARVVLGIATDGTATLTILDPAGRVVGRVP